jgi:hypothetical protein
MEGLTFVLVAPPLMGARAVAAVSGRRAAIGERRYIAGLVGERETEALRVESRTNAHKAVTGRRTSKPFASSVNGRRPARTKTLRSTWPRNYLVGSHATTVNVAHRLEVFRDSFANIERAKRAAGLKSILMFELAIGPVDKTY